MAGRNSNRTLNKLTASEVTSAKPRDKVYKLADGGGLVLTIKPNGGRYWQFRYKGPDGKEKTASFGTADEVTLKEARERRSAARSDLRNGITPKDRERLDDEARRQKQRLLGHSFESVAHQWFDRVKGQWKNEKHRDQVWMTLETYALPTLGKIPVGDIKAYDVRLAIEALTDRGVWETAQRTFQRITAVLDEAVERELIEYNPALVLRGKLFRTRPDSTKHNHFPALPPSEFPELVQALNAAQLHPITRMAVEMQMLTFVRPFELRSAEWAHFNLDERVWAIPAETMKMKRDHLVPLSDQIMELLEALKGKTGNNRYLFPHRSDGSKFMSEGTVNMTIKRLGFAGRHTAHGFRSTASTYLNEMKRGDYQRFNPDAIERQLAHIEPDEDKRAYDRSEHWEERVMMMQEWADFVDRCADTSGKVAVFRREVAK